MKFYTADLHFGHPSIIRYSKRPFIKAGDLDDKGLFVSQEIAIEATRRMNDGLIHNFNSRVKDGDLVKHVGDFCTTGKARGVDGFRTKADGYLSKLNGTWTLIEGNHDPNNGVKSSSVATIDRIAGKLAFVSHYPTDNPVHDPDLIEWVHKHCVFAVCGHIHNSWDYRWVSHHVGHDILNINVGVDVRRYMPLNESEVFGIYSKCLRTRGGNAN